MTQFAPSSSRKASSSGVTIFSSGVYKVVLDEGNSCNREHIFLPLATYFTMGWFNHDSEEAQAYNTVTGGSHKATLSHEMLAAAAAFEAAKAYEHHVSANGQPPNHEKAKEILAAAVGAFVDREVETKGLDTIDKEKAKHQAKKQAEAALAASGQF
ncbi:hypothetical protein BDN72DRAFT_831321 [Pluteus cervinus]|uniref:Uncharacterized protein n=1 Tax=Pluteus cervinus TaxID=181527 RepID=A0ACD3BE17_9AGAR|nr:hypothetical protein BDN72DRAFT_831321 [Pluteus cervinus]